MTKDLFAGGLQAGRCAPLGATPTADGVNFAVFSAHARKIEICVYDESGRQEIARLPLPARTGDVWHGHLRGAGPGLVYGLRAHGPYAPEAGHRFAPTKLLLDPYARALTGEFRWTDAHLADQHLERDNATDTYKAVVVDAHDFDWRDDRPPATPWSDTVLYEVHVKGFSQTHPEIAPQARGRYAGLASEAAIAHFRKLGVTALNLLPVHQAIDELGLARRGRVNYWGYNTLGFFAPSMRYAAADPRHEFREMVATLHRAGIEVILDVVYNHTAEGDQRGPIIGWRGLDNASYYRLRHDDRRFYENHSGCGNTIDATHPRSMQMIMDSLRYWVTEMHVDGFRFDLASILARTATGFDAHAPLMMAIAQDPVLAGVKLIAEPWDAGPGGYQLGGFPLAWSEWNDRFRRASRAFWIRKTADRGELVARLAGSQDIFGKGLRSPRASINYVCSHDGFTLHDLLSYDHKHNDANGEENRDGESDNLSWNCGHEGPSDLLAVNAMRARLKRAMLATLFLARGVPMLLGGDEISRTQQGNNNAYSLDCPQSWYDWASADAEMTDFVANLAALRRRYPHLSADRWLSGEADPDGEADVLWLNRRGEPMQGRQWDEANRFVLGMVLSGPPALAILINGEARDWAFPLPAGRWRRVMDTGQAASFDVPAGELATGETLDLKERSVTVLERVAD
ncbi:MAG: glycogen debranching protein GlgX [Burkholderiaceae bacterium]